LGDLAVQLLTGCLAPPVFIPSATIMDIQSVRHPVPAITEAFMAAPSHLKFGGVIFHRKFPKFLFKSCPNS